jgi:5-methylcytosine-specific restriction endonuclease McrA
VAWGQQSNRVIPPDWDARKAVVHDRDGGICHVCGHAGADQVDHKLAVAHGGSHDIDNLGLIHGSTCPTCGRRCHTDKTQREAAAGRAARRATAKHPRPRKHPGRD